MSRASLFSLGQTERGSRPVRFNCAQIFILRIKNEMRRVLEQGEKRKKKDAIKLEQMMKHRFLINIFNMKESERDK